MWRTVRERIDSIEHWELITLMVLTGGAILTLYSLVVLFVWAAMGGENYHVGLLIGLLIAVGAAAVQYWREMRKFRQLGVPIEEEEVPWIHEQARTLSEELGITKPDLRVIEDSTPNAFAVGRRNDGIVFFHSGLFEEMEQEEITAILAHELSHLRNRDSILTMVAESIRGLLVRFAGVIMFFITFISLVMASVMDDKKPSKAEQRRRARIQQTIVGVTTATVSGIVLIFSRFLTRYREYTADITAVRAMDNPRPMQSALQKLEQSVDKGEMEERQAASSLYIFNRSEAFLDRLFRTHPSFDDRVTTLEETFENDRTPSPLDTGATLGRFTKFGLSVAPAYIVLFGVTAFGIVLFQTVTKGPISSVSGAGSTFEGILVISVLALFLSLVAFSWAMLFADGGEPRYGFGTVIALLIIFFLQGLFPTVPYIWVLPVAAFGGVIILSGLQLNRIREHLDAS